MTIKIDLLPSERSQPKPPFLVWLWVEFILPAIVGLSGWGLAFYAGTDKRNSITTTIWAIQGGIDLTLLGAWFMGAPIWPWLLYYCAFHALSGLAVIYAVARAFYDED